MGDRVGSSSSVASLKPFPKERICPPPVRLSFSRALSLAVKNRALAQERNKVFVETATEFFSLSLFLSPATPSFLFLSLLPLVILTIHIVPVSLNEYCIVHCTRSTTCIYYYYYYYSIGVFFPGLLSSPM